MRERRELDVLGVIALGGALGTPARYGVSRLITVAPNTFPWATFVTNLSGAFALGLFVTLLIARFPPSRYARPFFAIGFLGSFTTFSTLAVETVTLVKDGHAALGVEYLVATVAAGLAACYLGVLLAADRIDVVLIAGLVIAGMIGAPARYMVESLVRERAGKPWPIGTLVVNISGSLLLGLLTGFTLYHAFPSTPRTILGTGFCGAYTTFSSFAYETIDLAESGETRAAARVVAFSMVLPALAAALGLALASL